MPYLRSLAVELKDHRLKSGGVLSALSAFASGKLKDHRLKPGGVYSGMFPCFFGGFESRLFSNNDSALINFGRVWEGSITSSTNPRSAAR